MLKSCWWKFVQNWSMCDSFPSCLDQGGNYRVWCFQRIWRAFLINSSGPWRRLRLWASTSVRLTSRETWSPGQPRAGLSRTGPPRPLSHIRHFARGHSVTRSSSCLTPWAMTGPSSCAASSQVIILFCQPWAHLSIIWPRAESGLISTLFLASFLDASFEKFIN